uniref:Elks delta-like protein n=1 Tax=Trypanosoma congolense (strain IL3000) TaxID=1068625 RepID=G0UX23_TRYCI|nr:conserved hypothetical protein [Trypanosoma congolense IL3000]
MDDNQKTSIKQLKQQLMELEQALLAQERLIQERTQKMQSLSTSIVETENSVEEGKEGLRTAEKVLKEAIQNNVIVRNERARLEEEAGRYMEHDEYMKRLSEADADLNEVETHIEGLVMQINNLSRTPNSGKALQRVTLVRLIAMLNDLHSSLQRSIQSVPHEEDNRAREVLKAIRELSRERERTYGHCLRKKREVMGVMELKKQKAEELLLESKRNIALLRDIHEETTLNTVEKIQKERRMLTEELENMKKTNMLLRDALSNAEFSRSADRGDTDKAQPSVWADAAPRCSADTQKEHLREHLKHLEDKVSQLKCTTDELRESMKSQMEKNTLKLKDLRHQVRSRQNETHRLENENRKLKSLCDSLASTLESK